MKRTKFTSRLLALMLAFSLFFGSAAGDMAIVAQAKETNVSIVPEDLVPFPGGATNAVQTLSGDNQGFVLTQSNVYDLLISYKSVYPEGMYWTNESQFYAWNGGIYYGGYGCAAFTFLLSDKAFGTLPSRIHYDWDNIRVGDILRINNDSHSVIVLSANGDKITVAEGNYNSSVHWGRVLSRNDLKSYSGTYVMTRWPKNPTVYNGVDYSAVYDYDFYVSKYKDIERAYGNNSEAALEHFVLYGMKEGRQAKKSFDVKAYANRYYDLRKAYKNNLVKYYQHYMNYGKKEGRKATNCSTMKGGITKYNGVNYKLVYEVGYYAKKYPDLRKAYGFDDELYIKHFVKYGMKEARQAKASFNVKKYRKRYSDLRKKYKTNYKKYYMHYITKGKKQGRKGN